MKVPTLISIILLVSFKNCESRMKVWKQKTNLIDPNNWEDNQVPCNSDTLLFPEKSYELIKLPDFNTKEIILPKDGGFVLDGSLKFQSKSSSCKPNQVKKFKPISQHKWLSSSNWITTYDSNEAKEEMDNQAIPHAERVPCDNDQVVFPINNSYVVDFQSMPQLSFKSVTLDRISYSVDAFRDLLLTEVGQNTFEGSENTLVLPSQCSGDKCACHTNNEALLDILCENELKQCGSADCVNPIKPTGFCCYVCGAIMHIDLADAGEFNLTQNQNAVYTAVTAADDAKNIDFHVSVVKLAGRPFLQLVMVDKYEYSEYSTQIMQKLKDSKFKRLLADNPKIFHLSGLPLKPNQSGHAFAFIFGTLFMVSFLMTILYVSYYDQNNLPRLLALLRNRELYQTSGVIFARFDNTQNTQENLDNSLVEVELDFGNQSVENLNSGFNNPMFEKKLDNQEKLVDEENEE